MCWKPAMQTDWPPYWRALTPRVVLGFALLTAGLMLGCGLYLYQALKHELSWRDHHEQLGKITLFRQTLAGLSNADVLRDHPDALTHFMVGHDGLALRVRSATGQLLLDSPTAVPVVSWSGLAQETLPLAGVDRHGHPWRGLAATATLANGEAVQLEVWRDAYDQHTLLEEYRTHLLWAGVLAVLLAAALGAWLVRRSLQPLAALTAAATAIHQHTLSQRLDSQAVPRELAGLVDAFNDVLGRLDTAFAQLNAYATDLAHEMRTPLGILLGQTQVALSRERSASAYRQVLADNAEELEQLARMVNDLLFLAKAEHGDKPLHSETLALHAEVAEVCEFFAMLAEDKQITLVSSGMLTLTVDRAALRRLLNNLLSNAIRYSTPGSQVHVTLDARLPGLIVDNLPADPLPAELNQLFDRFYSRGGHGEGHGLGLPIARAIARLHGGELHAERCDARLCLVARLAARPTGDA